MTINEGVYTAGALRINYRVYTPNEQTAGLPLLVYLHGAGERGQTDESLPHVERHGIPRLLAEGKEIPAAILVPQCPTYLVWDNIVQNVKLLIDLVASRYKTDVRRAYLTGSSMGGYGTFALALTYPSFFAAIAPISGGGTSWRASNLVTTPVFAVHGKNDTLVPPVSSEMMTTAVNANGGNARLLLLEGFGHNDAIDYAYRHAGVIDFLLSKTRTDFSPVPEFCHECF